MKDSDCLQFPTPWSKKEFGTFNSLWEQEILDLTLFKRRVTMEGNWYFTVMMLKPKLETKAKKNEKDGFHVRGQRWERCVVVVSAWVGTKWMDCMNVCSEFANILFAVFFTWVFLSWAYMEKKSEAMMLKEFNKTTQMFVPSSIPGTQTQPSCNNPMNEKYCNI